LQQLYILFCFKRQKSFYTYRGECERIYLHLEQTGPRMIACTW